MSLVFISRIPCSCRKAWTAQTGCIMVECIKEHDRYSRKRPLEKPGLVDTVSCVVISLVLIQLAEHCFRGHSHKDRSLSSLTGAQGSDLAAKLISAAICLALIGGGFNLCQKMLLLLFKLFWFCMF